MVNSAPIERVRELFSYDASDGTLRWKLKPRRGPAYRIGSIAGNLDKRGYITISVDGIRMRAHRAIWAIMYGEWPTLEIDHINGNRFDNRLENLRLASRSENARNRSYPNKVGLRGVCFIKRNTLHPWRAQMRSNGRRLMLGHFATAEEAHAAYMAAAVADHGEFARAA